MQRRARGVWICAALVAATLVVHAPVRGLPFLFYLHPWEIDPGQPRLKVGLKSRFRHYTNIASCERKLDALLGEFPMGPVWDALQAPAIPVTEPLRYLQVATADGAGTSA